MNNSKKQAYFSSDGGEMGQLIRSKDWSKTALGEPDHWPESLKTVVAVMLDNPFGMYIAWGEHFTQIYNDGYRPILGAKKHPQALGSSTEETFAEIWDTIGPMFHAVMQGESFRFSDLLFILDRNESPEECYFDFAYSPIRLTDGTVGGVLVTVVETTEKKKATDALEEADKRFRNTVKQAPVGITILRGPDYVVEMANQAYLDIIDKPESSFVGRPLFDSLPEVKETVQTLLDGVLQTGIPYHGNELPVPINRFGQTAITYFDFLYHPLREENDEISGIIVTVTEVMEKVEARKKIEQNEARLNVVLQASELGMWELNLKTKAVHYSARYLEILGGYKNKVSLTHEQLLKHLHPDDMGVREKAFKTALKTGYLHYEARLIWADGSIHWMEGRGKVFFDAENQPDKMMGTIRDITAEKNYQQKLEASEKQFRSLAESLPQLIWETDAKGNPIFASGRWKEYTGISPDGEAQWKQIVHPDDYQGNALVWMHSLETGEPYKHDIRIRNKDGQYRWHAIIGEPIYEDDKIRKWVGACTDIHAEKAFTQELEMQVKERTNELIQINESLKKSEQRYHLMIEEVQDYAIIYLNSMGFVENWNQGAQKIKGYRAEEIIGKSFSVFYNESDRKNNLPEQLLTQARTTGKARHEGWRVRKNGSVFWANVTITAIHNDEGEIMGYSKVTHDLTERKEDNDRLKANQIELEEKNSALEKMNKELQSFAYISSHDLQEPLRKIQAFSTLIMEKEYPNLTDNGKDIFNRMHSAANRMQILINDLLAYSRTNVQERKFEKADLSKIIEEVQQDMAEELHQKNAVIENHAQITIKIIPFQFRQLIYNLVSNALKFSREGVPPHITIKAELVDAASIAELKIKDSIKYCHLSVSDNGIGFEQQYSERIFQVFQRLHNRSQYSGTGIGLAIVKRIVENHHGYISASGEKNKGASFDIYVPLH